MVTSRRIVCVARSTLGRAAARALKQQSDDYPATVLIMLQLKLLLTGQWTDRAAGTIWQQHTSISSTWRAAGICTTCAAKCAGALVRLS